MSRLIIDVTGEQHKKIKLLATLQGKTIKDYVLDKLFPSSEEGESWEELKSILANRIEQADRESPSGKTFDEITEEVIRSKKTKE